MCVLYLSPLLTPSIIFPVDLLKFKLTLLNFWMLNLYRRKRANPLLIVLLPSVKY